MKKKCDAQPGIAVEAIQGWYTSSNNGWGFRYYENYWGWMIKHGINKGEGEISIKQPPQFYQTSTLK